MVILWIVRNREYLFYNDEQPDLLWLLLVCVGTLNDRNLPTPWPKILVAWSLGVSGLVLIYAFYSTWRRTLRTLLSAFALIFCFFGFLVLVVSAVQWFTNQMGGTFCLPGIEIAIRERTDLLSVFTIGLVMSVIGISLLLLLRTRTDK